MTPEEVTQSISAAYDSVNLINQLKVKSQLLSVEDGDTMIRNVEHLKIMMTKEEFVAGLTPEQTTEINALIA